MFLLIQSKSMGSKTTLDPLTFVEWTKTNKLIIYSKYLLFCSAEESKPYRFRLNDVSNYNFWVKCSFKCPNISWDQCIMATIVSRTRSAITKRLMFLKVQYGSLSCGCITESNDVMYVSG